MDRQLKVRMCVCMDHAALPMSYILFPISSHPLRRPRQFTLSPHPQSTIKLYISRLPRKEPQPVANLWLLHARTLHVLANAAAVSCGGGGGGGVASWGLGLEVKWRELGVLLWMGAGAERKWI